MKQGENKTKQNPGKKNKQKTKQNHGKIENA